MNKDEMNNVNEDNLVKLLRRGLESAIERQTFMVVKWDECLFILASLDELNQKRKVLKNLSDKIDALEFKQVPENEFLCDECGEQKSKSELVSLPDDGQICMGCGQNLPKCDLCGKLTPKITDWGCGDDNSILCKDCFVRRSQCQKGIQDCHFCYEDCCDNTNPERK